MTVRVIRKVRAAQLYHDPDGWWIGYYRGDTHHYLGFLVVGVRWARKIR